MERKYLKLYEKLITENEAPLVQYAIRTVGCEMETAKDIVQDVFVKAWLHIEKLYEHENPVGWLFKTAYNVARHEKDRIYRSMEISEGDMDAIGSLDVELGMEHILPKGLKKRECEIILLRLEREWSFEAIAEHYGMREDATRKQFSRAIIHCRALMTKAIKRENQSGATR